MTLALLADASRGEALEVLGTCETTNQDGLPYGTLALLGPAQPDFWQRFIQSSEYLDGTADPLDRWSERVIAELADATGGIALFPFGSPARPYISWALRTGRCWVSPVGLLVHEEAGLWVSFRGAILFEDAQSKPVEIASPCDTCMDQPCLTACPVSALSSEGYDLKTCHGFLDRREGRDCMEQGCAVRRACPISQRHGRKAAQSAFHMRAFHPRGRD
jgi:hypothetical protein